MTLYFTRFFRFRPVLLGFDTAIFHPFSFSLVRFPLEKISRDFARLEPEFHSLFPRRGLVSIVTVFSPNLLYGLPGKVIKSWGFSQISMMLLAYPLL